jgi:hypothetical protein
VKLRNGAAEHAPVLRAALCARLGTAAALTLAAAAPVAAVEPVLQGAELCMPAVFGTLPPEAQAALVRIDELPRRLLAAAMYLQARGLETRWSWSDEQIRAYEASPEHAAALAAIARVADRFAAENPGFTLRVNTDVRSLDAQLAAWNANASVAASAAPLLEAANPKCAPSAPQRFVAWLRGYRPSRPNLAPPGLSPHGQAQAFDFQVLKGSVIVAPPDAGRIEADWIGAGWAARLAEAIRDAGPAFTGPLAMPNEPWHYAYDAKRDAVAAAQQPAETGEPVPARSAIVIPRPKPDWTRRD